MSGWLASGRRRDVCVLCYDTDGLRGQELKSRLESHYDERLDPSSFYGALDSLVSKGYLEERTDGIHDVYALTDGGRAALEEHLAWLESEVGGLQFGSADAESNAESDAASDTDAEIE